MPSAARERALLVGLDIKGRPYRSATASNDMASLVEESLNELSVLAESAGAEVIDRVIQSREAPQAATLIGSGKVEELARHIKAFGSTLLSLIGI